MDTCGLKRMAQVNGYAVKLMCELPKEEPHVWHWDGTFAAEWTEPDLESKNPHVLVRTSTIVYKQPVVI